MEAKNEVQKIGTQDEWVNGVRGLEDFLGVSHSTAQKIKNRVPHFQIGRTIRFRKADILKAIEKNYQIIE
ncbi:helix-turn-helix domain-containing protein [bacterium]|nr:helix-turn-helix domain-containing protein [bacterium]MBV5348842.1 helix-turn-helix domain-containing protein [bacterium]